MQGPEEIGEVNPPEPAVAKATPPSVRQLPFSRWWPLLAGAMAGVVLRLVFFGSPGNWYAAMMGSFIYLSPILVGAVTVYVAERKQRRSWAYYFWAPFMANLFFVLGTLLVMIEGLICAIVIVPLFATLGALGGVASAASQTGQNRPCTASDSCH